MGKNDYGKRWEYTKDVIFGRLDKRMREDKLYLDYTLTLPNLSGMMGTNST